MNKRPTMWLRATAALMLLATAGSVSAKADALEDFYKSKSLQLIISSTPGGGYDAMARAYARYMGSYMPGSPPVIVRNMPGAGGITAGNWLYATAPQDGTTLAAVHQGVAFQPLFGEKAARFDATKFGWVGNANSEVGVFFVRHQSKMQTVQDLFTNEVFAAATDGGSTTAFTYRTLNGLIGTKIKIVTGYPGSNESFLALERGEVEGFFTVWTSVKARGALYRDKQIRVLLQIAMEKTPELPDVPLASEFVKSEADRLALELSVAPGKLGRPYIAPPNLPKDRLEALRKAFMETSRNKSFVAEIDKMGLEVGDPMSGADAQALITRLNSTPPDIVAKVAALTRE
jgi:tripartite-type tricarboxylate transporter receptor subunit TctC